MTVEQIHRIDLTDVEVPDLPDPDGRRSIRPDHLTVYYLLTNGRWTLAKVNLFGRYLRRNGRLSSRGGGRQLTLTDLGGNMVVCADEWPMPQWALRLAEQIRPTTEQDRRITDSIAIARLMYEDETGERWETLPHSEKGRWRARARSALDAMSGVDPS